MIYLQAYLVIALISWVFFFVSAYKKNWGTFVGSFFFAVAWPSAHVINYIMWRQSSRCAWCGKVNKRDDAQIQAHILECEKHPMRERLEVILDEVEHLREERFEARAVLKRIINLQACNYTAEEFKRIALDTAYGAVSRMDSDA